MKEKFVPYDIALELRGLGFVEECIAFFIGKNGFRAKFGNIYTFKNDRSGIIAAPLWQDAFDWIETEFQLTGMIHTVYPYKDSPGLYYVYGIISDKDLDLVNPNNKFGDLLEKSHQDIPGNYVNHELLNELIFSEEYDYGFKTKNEAKLACLKKLIELCKKN